MTDVSMAADAVSVRRATKSEALSFPIRIGRMRGEDGS